MVLFWPVQQELDCINLKGDILGKIKFGLSANDFIFHPAHDSIVLTTEEKSEIAKKLSGLTSGQYSIPMQDDD